MCTSNIRSLQWNGFHLFRKSLIKSFPVEVWKKVWSGVYFFHTFDSPNELVCLEGGGGGHALVPCLA